MSDHPPDVSTTLEPYPCNKIVYRAIISESWLKAGKTVVKHQAFRRRRDKDPTGITVNPTPLDCTEGLTDPIEGVLSLHVGKVRDIGLDIVPDRPTHANIMGVPFREGEGGNEAEAERLARLLAEQARVHSLGDPRFP